MRTLNPTLWRTCRVLAGQTRLAFLRQLYAHPGQSVSSLALAVHVGLSDASQELRRLQSRGLLQVDRMGRFTVYRLGADPQVPSAAPLLKAIQAALALHPSDRDPEMCVIANGLAHERRIAIAHILLETPRTMFDLQMRLHLSSYGLAQHLRSMEESGFAKQKGELIYFQVPPHPLARALANLLKQAQ